MYRIFCESYYNFINSIGTDNARADMAKTIGLLVDINKYNEEEKKKSVNYKKVNDLICYMKANIDKYPKFKAFLWTLESRNLKGKNYNKASKEELEEQSKLINSFLKLAYWY